MALPMVHLLAARAWAQDKPELYDNPDYYLGAISPDAIHIRDGDDKSRKNEIHYNNWRSPDLDAVLEYWREHDSPFDIGYGIHVLLDGQWATDFRRAFPEMLLPNGKPDPEIYYNDTCVTDFELYRDSELTQTLMDLVRRGRAPEDHPKLTQYEFEAWREMTLQFYQRPCPMNGPVRFLNRDYTERFLKKCLQLMSTTYERKLNMNEIQRGILDRRSTRGFSETPLTEAEIQTLVDAALASPTARNSQDWHFTFVTNRELLDQFSADFRRVMTAKMEPEYAEKYAKYDVLFHPPLCVFITLPEQPSSRFSQVDAGIAVENLALAAQGMGMGSVILGMPMELFEAEPEWERRLGFPEGHHFAIAIVIGHNTVTKEAHPIGEGKVHFVD